MAPTLRPGQVVVVADNLWAHKKGEEVRELVEAQGCCELIFVPAYSSLEYNPIEEAFSKIKGLLCA